MERAKEIQREEGVLQETALRRAKQENELRRRIEEQEIASASRLRQRARSEFGLSSGGVGFKNFSGVGFNSDRSLNFSALARDRRRQEEAKSKADPGLNFLQGISESNNELVKIWKQLGLSVL